MSEVSFFHVETVVYVIFLTFLAFHVKLRLMRWLDEIVPTRSM